MCLRDLDIRSVIPVPWSEPLEEVDDSGDLTEPMDLGDAVKAAIERNKRAWIVAKH